MCGLGLGQQPLKKAYAFNEENLIRTLLGNYVKEARPVTNPNEAVSVSVKFSFVRIEDLVNKI